MYRSHPRQVLHRFGKWRHWRCGNQLFRVSWWWTGMFSVYLFPGISRADYLEFFEHFYGSVLRLTYMLSRDHQVINRVVPLAKLQLTHRGLTKVQMSTTLVVLNLAWPLLLHHHSLLIMTSLSKMSSRYFKRVFRTFIEIFIACKRISWSKGPRRATRASQWGAVYWKWIQTWRRWGPLIPSCWRKVYFSLLTWGQKVLDSTSEMLLIGHKLRLKTSIYNSHEIRADWKDRRT